MTSEIETPKQPDEVRPTESDDTRRKAEAKSDWEKSEPAETVERDKPEAKSDWEKSGPFAISCGKGLGKGPKQVPLSDESE